MSAYLRPHGDESAEFYGDYFTPKEIKKLEVGKKYEILCQDGLNYIVEIKKFDPIELTGHIHFMHWKKNYDFRGSLLKLYITYEGHYTEGLIGANNRYQITSDKKRKSIPSSKPTISSTQETTSTTTNNNNNNTTTTNANTNITKSFHENTRYDENFLSKPRLFSGSKRRTNQNSSESEVDSEEPTDTKGKSNIKIPEHALLSMFPFDDEPSEPIIKSQEMESTKELVSNSNNKRRKATKNHIDISQSTNSSDNAMVESKQMIKQSTTNPLKPDENPLTTTSSPSLSLEQEWKAIYKDIRESTLLSNTRYTVLLHQLLQMKEKSINNNINNNNIEIQNHVNELEKILSIRYYTDQLIETCYEKYFK